MPEWSQSQMHTNYTSKHICLLAYWSTYTLQTGTVGLIPLEVWHLETLQSNYHSCNARLSGADIRWATESEASLKQAVLPAATHSSPSHGPLRACSPRTAGAGKGYAELTLLDCKGGQARMELRGSTMLWKTDFNRFRFRFFQATDLWQKEIGTCRNLLWRSMGNAFLKHPKKRYPLTGLPIVQLSNEKLSTGNQMSRILWVTYLLNAKFFIGVKIPQTSKLGQNPGISWSPDPKWSELVHAWILIHLYPPNVFLIVQLTGPQVAIDHCEYLCSCAICPVCSRCSWHSVMCIPNAIGFITMAGSGNETCLHIYTDI